MAEVLERRGGRSTDSLPPIDYEQLRAGIGSDPDMLRELVPIFLEDTASCMHRLDIAVRARDSHEIHAVGHLIAGTASAFAAPATTILARRLERMGASGNLKGVDAAFDSLHAALERVRPLIQACAADLETQSNAGHSV